MNEIEFSIALSKEEWPSVHGGVAIVDPVETLHWLPSCADFFHYTFPFSAVACVDWNWCTQQAGTDGYILGCCTE